MQGKINALFQKFNFYHLLNITFIILIKLKNYVLDQFWLLEITWQFIGLFSKWVGECKTEVIKQLRSGSKYWNLKWSMKTMQWMIRIPFAFISYFKGWKRLSIIDRSQNIFRHFFLFNIFSNHLLNMIFQIHSSYKVFILSTKLNNL